MQRRSLLSTAGAAAVLPLIGSPVRAQAQAGDVVGAGSALPRAVYQKWIGMAAAQAGLKVRYELAPGAAALERLKARAVDFASVDYARRGAFLRENHLIQFPTVLTGIVPFVNLPGVADGQLRLTGELLADIFLGKIARWNDARVKAQNNGLALPDLAVVPVHRTDPAGATVLFTTYLARASEAWAAGPRAGTTVQWPEGVGAVADGLDGQVAKVKATPGAVSFAGETTVKDNRFATAFLLNHAGEFVKAGAASFSKAAAAADWEAPAFNMDLVDLDAKGAWPIVGANFVLVPDNPAAEKVRTLRDTFNFFEWAFKHGVAAANELEVPEVPESAHRHIHEVWRRAKDPSGRPVWEA